MKHKHHDAIVAWAGGAEIQHRAPGSSEWKDNADPAWVTDYEYRVKPAREYPETLLTVAQLAEAYRDGGHDWGEAYIDLANTVLRHACDAGQVVTREEFDRAIGDRKDRDMAVARAVSSWHCRAVTARVRMPCLDEELTAIIAEVK